jgi:hypothetical protein
MQVDLRTNEMAESNEIEDFPWCSHVAFLVQDAVGEDFRRLLVCAGDF